MSRRVLHRQLIVKRSGDCQNSVILLEVRCGEGFFYCYCALMPCGIGAFLLVRRWRRTGGYSCSWPMHLCDASAFL